MDIYCYDYAYQGYPSYQWCGPNGAGYNIGFSYDVDMDVPGDITAPDILDFTISDQRIDVSESGGTVSIDWEVDDYDMSIDGACTSYWADCIEPIGLGEVKVSVLDFYYE